MTLVVIAAVAANGVIGRDNGLPWWLPADLRRFKALTMGHAIIVGRRTWESIGRPLPGRRMIVLTGQEGWTAPGVEVAHSLDEALELAGDDTAFVAGGEAVYRAALPRADVLELTRVHADVEGDARFPAFDAESWRRVWHEDHPADATHAWPFTFERYEPLST